MGPSRTSAPAPSPAAPPEPTAAAPGGATSESPPRGLLLQAAWGSVWPVLTGVLLALLLQFVLQPMLGIYNSKLLMDVGVAAILAASLNIVNGMTGQFSIGHAGFMALGGYTAAAVTYYASLALWGSAARHGGPLGSGELLFGLSCLVGGVFSAAAGWIVGLPSLRLRGDYLAIVTLGFGEIIRVLLELTGPVLDAEEAAAMTWRQAWPPPVGGSLGFSGLPTYTSLFWVFTFLAVTLVAAHRLKHSGIGRAMISVREDEVASQAMGVNTTRVKVRSFVFAAALAGMAGGLYAHQSGSIIRPVDAGFQPSFDIVIMVVLGGRGSISGCVLAATVVTLLPEVLRDFDQYRMIVFALLLIVMMLVRPQGLLGNRELWELRWPGRRRRAA